GSALPVNGPLDSDPYAGLPALPSRGLSRGPSADSFLCACKPDLAQRGSALELHPANGITVPGEDAVQLRARVSSSCVHELDRARDAFLVTTPHQVECPARRFEACVGGGDRRSRHGGGFVRRAHLERDPVREILPLSTGAIGLISGHGPSGRVAAAVEEVPRHAAGRAPEVIAATERELGTLGA